MANEYLVNKADLDGIADDINAILNTSDALVFPDGFRSKLADIAEIVGNADVDIYRLTITFNVTAYTPMGGGGTMVGPVGRVHDASGLPSSISNNGTTERLLIATTTTSGCLKLSVASVTGATARISTLNADKGYYLLTILNPTDSVNIVIAGTSP